MSRTPTVGICSRSSQEPTFKVWSKSGQYQLRYRTEVWQNIISQVYSCNRLILTRLLVTSLSWNRMCSTPGPNLIPVKSNWWWQSCLTASTYWRRIWSLPHLQLKGMFSLSLLQNHLGKKRQTRIRSSVSNKMKILILFEKIPQSGICPAPCVLCQCTVVFACRLFCLCTYGQCRAY